MMNDDAGTLELSTRENNGIRIIDVRGEVSLYHAHNFKEKIIAVCSESGAGFVINLRDTEYIDSSGVGVLIFAGSHCRKKGVPMRLAQVHGSVKRVIELTKLAEYLPISESEQDAIDWILTRNRSGDDPAGRKAGPDEPR